MEKTFENIRKFYTIVDTQEQANAAREALIQAREPVWDDSDAFLVAMSGEDFPVVAFGFEDWLACAEAPEGYIQLPYDEFMKILGKDDVTSELIKALKNFVVAIEQGKTLLAEEYEIAKEILSRVNPKC